MKNWNEQIMCSAYDEHIRDFSSSRRVSTDKESHEVLQPVVEHIAGENFASGVFTEQGARAINRLLRVQGVLKIVTCPFKLSVEFVPALDGEAMESVFLQIIKDEFFPGVGCEIIKFGKNYVRFQPMT
jgi:hypothetical protein